MQGIFVEYVRLIGRRVCILSDEVRFRFIPRFAVFAWVVMVATVNVGF